MDERRTTTEAEQCTLHGVDCALCAVAEHNAKQNDVNNVSVCSNDNVNEAEILNDKSNQ